ncbi:MAG TPA: EMC3/TMCO1 family protein [Verrucomicrobiae bacterium]|nr:EMC3/TMCO1 family protein [Verrucomicrobiae bacterium]
MALPVITSANDAIIIFIIATVIAFINTAINRVLINYFVGWEQYRVMQKEMNEYRSETMAAMRANDKKQVEKLKKRESQIKNMQAQMLKPQMVQFGFSFVYIIIWFFVLTPTFKNIPMVYVPGIAALPVLYWYPIGSFFLGLLASRIIGIMPIET